MSGNLWEASCAEDVPSVSLSGDHSADLVVIGGGFTGCAAALEAVQAGATVIVLEAQTVGHGGSGRNVGLVNAGLWLPPDQVEQVMGQEAGARLNAALAHGPKQVFELVERFGIQCEATRTGTLHCAHAPKGMDDLRERHRQQAARHAPVSLLEADPARARLGSDRIHGALHDARAGTVQPMGYVRGLARAAVGLGAVVAEGAGQELLANEADSNQTDASGNTKLGDIGVFICDKIKKHFTTRGIEISLKYIDPSYYIRSVPTTPSDRMFCLRLAQNAIHAAMAGRTGMVVGYWNSEFTHVPIEAAVSQRKTVDPEEDLWLSVLETTGQPDRMINIQKGTC